MTQFHMCRVLLSDNAEHDASRHSWGLRRWNSKGTKFPLSLLFSSRLVFQNLEPKICWIFLLFPFPYSILEYIQKTSSTVYLYLWVRVRMTGHCCSCRRQLQPSSSARSASAPGQNNVNIIKEEARRTRGKILSIFFSIKIIEYIYIYVYLLVTKRIQKSYFSLQKYTFLPKIVCMCVRLRVFVCVLGWPEWWVAG